MTGDNIEFANSAGLDLELDNSGQLETDPNAISFGGEDIVLGIENLGGGDFLDNSDPTFDESNLDLEILDSLEESDLDQLEDKLQGDQAVSALFEHLSANTKMVTALNRGVTSNKLSMIGEAINADLLGMYKSDAMINTLVNSIAAGAIVGEHFEKAVPNTVKMFYVPASKSNSIHLHAMAGTGLKAYKSTPAIQAFNVEAIDSLSALYKAQIRGFDTLSSYLRDAYFKPIAKKSTEGDNKAYLAQDNLTIAKTLSKSKMSVQAGMKRLEGIGCDEPRRNKIALLAKTIKDNA